MSKYIRVPLTEVMENIPGARMRRTANDKERKSGSEA